MFNPPLPGNIHGLCGICALIQASSVPFARFLRRSLYVATERFRARSLDASSREHGAGDESQGILPMPLPYPEAELNGLNVGKYSSRKNSRKVKIRRACQRVNRIIAVMSLHRHRRDFYSLIPGIEIGNPNLAQSIMCQHLRSQLSSWCRWTLSFASGAGSAPQKLKDLIDNILRPMHYRANDSVKSVAHKVIPDKLKDLLV